MLILKVKERNYKNNDNDADAYDAFYDDGGDDDDSDENDLDILL